jgi:2-polyprenyl-6-methoxyphenol hydroxylase-like FAD-dependent oxidoreductase
MQVNPKILICGAGIAGLTAAIRLARDGVKAVVVERAPDVRADGYIISLSHRSYRYAEALGLMPEIRRRSVGVTASSYHRGHTTLLEFNYDRLFTGVDVVQIMRDDLQDILYTTARDLAEIRFGTTIAGIEHGEQDAAVTFSDGRCERFDVVIGADGLHSVVRDLTFDPREVSHRRLDLCSAAFRLPNIAGLSHKFETHMERGRYMVMFTTPDNGLAAVFVWATTMAQAPPAEQRRQVLFDAFAGTGEIPTAVLAHCPIDGAFYMDPLVQVRMANWFQDRSVLVGDAAHCLTLLSGQGATMAFTGACALAERLVALPAQQAFAAYQADLQKTVIDVQDRTRKISRWYVPCTWWRQSARDLGMRLFPATWFERHFQAKYTRA